ncbi:MAG: esterase family protein [Muribaculaceae bacterium]|nr:esterase family protein [Muribaculaceae bacterium]
MKKTLLLLLALVAAMSASAQWGGRTITDTIHSRILGVPRAVNVYLPRSFRADTARTYPVLYLLHGMHGDNGSWEWMQASQVLDRLINSGEADEMVVVTPHAGGNPALEQNGYFNVKDWLYEDFFFQELMPEIEKRYRAGGSRDLRAVAGFSMGGGGATAYAQRHPDAFCAAYAMSALMDIPDNGAAVPAQRPDDLIDRLTRSVQANSCTNFVTNADEATRNALRSVQWFVDCGDDDFLLDRNLEFFHAMRAAGIPLQLRVRDGGHDGEYWHTALYTCLPFVSRAFSANK